MIYYSDDILKDYDLAPVKWYIDHKPWVYGWKSDHGIPYGHWNYDVTGTAVTNSENVFQNLPVEFQNLWVEINEDIFNGKAIPVRCYANRHTFGTEGYIHVDSHRKQDHTVVIYLNEEWSAEWGGETVFYNEDKTQITSSVLPKFKRIAVFPGMVPHKASGLSRVCPGVRETLMFKVSIDPEPLSKDEEKLKEFLVNIGTDQIPHKVGTLKDHLMRVYHILVSINAPAYVCLAGGLHSVYGTNVFKDNPELDKSAVLEMFGPEVNHLVQMFSTINRPDCLEDMDNAISDKDMFDLRLIECANLHDQSALNSKDYPSLFKFAIKSREMLKK